MNNSPELVPPLSEGTETEAALKRLLASERFRKNSSLRHMLEYLVTRTLSGGQNQIKESTVAMDVFGRARDFDSRIDNIVRVQAHRLRKLLTSYYEAEGAGERIRFSIPRGGYIPHIEEVAADGPAELKLVSPIGADSALEPSSVKLEIHPKRFSSLARLTLAFLAGVLVCSVTLWALRLIRPEAKRAAGSESAASMPLAAVWGPILKPGLDCVVSYSNPVFLATGDPPAARVYIPYRGLLSVPPGARINISPSDLNLAEGVFGPNPSFYFSDGWSGVGEVAAMHRLAALLAPEVSLRVIRSRALTFADVKDSNVIFLGSPWANDMQKKINLIPTPLVNDNEGNILNLNPRKGEPARFRAQTDPATRQILSTYGLFSVLPGVSPGTKVFISAGVNSYGTAGAAEFMTTSGGVKEVMRRLGTDKQEVLPDYFQIVVRSEMIRGEPVENRLVLARAIRQRS